VRLPFYQVADAFQSLFGDEVVVLGEDGPFGIDVDACELAPFQDIGLVAEGF